MAVPQLSALWDHLAIDTDVDGSKVEVDFSGVSSTIAFAVEADNTGNTSTKCYLKMWDSSGDPGATVPDWILPIAGGKKYPYFFNAGFGHTISNDLWIQCVTDDGDSGVTGPTEPVTVKVWHK